jgi:hypothetical protein
MADLIHTTPAARRGVLAALAGVAGITAAAVACPPIESVQAAVLPEDAGADAQLIRCCAAIEDNIRRSVAIDVPWFNTPREMPRELRKEREAMVDEYHALRAELHGLQATTRAGLVALARVLVMDGDYDNREELGGIVLAESILTMLGEPIPPTEQDLWEAREVELGLAEADEE